MRTSILGLSAAILACTSTPALAQDADVPSEFSISANVALVSDYRFRGVSFSDGDIAIQGGIDVAHDSGFYVGTWASSIEDSTTFGHTEVDFYGGWSGEVTPGIAVDVGLLYYYYPNGNEALGGPSDYFEPYASISGTLGPVEATLGIAYAWDGQSSLGNQHNTYIFTDFGVGIPNTPISLNAHLGYTDGILAPDTDGDAFDYSIGASVAINDILSVGVSYVGVEGPSINDFTDDAVVFTIGASI